MGGKNGRRGKGNGGPDMARGENQKKRRKEKKTKVGGIVGPGGGGGSF